MTRRCEQLIVQLLRGLVALLRPGKHRGQQRFKSGATHFPVSQTVHLTSQEEASCPLCTGCKGGSPCASSQAREQQQSSAEDGDNRWHVLECLPLQRFLKTKYCFQKADHTDSED